MVSLQCPSKSSRIRTESLAVTGGEIWWQLVAGPGEAQPLPSSCVFHNSTHYESKDISFDSDCVSRCFTNSPTIYDLFYHQKVGRTREERPDSIKLSLGLPGSSAEWKSVSSSVIVNDMSRPWDFQQYSVARPDFSYTKPAPSVCLRVSRRQHTV